ncbi:smx5 [Trematomus bernacchii]|uniref:smx5 n=1 Tax=Trematomus bernacchii TaxID=40690 RepID=UPI00146F9223|nr:smx5 [Trematomus bernacchii]
MSRTSGAPARRSPSSVVAISRGVKRHQHQTHIQNTPLAIMLFYSFFKSLVGKDVVVELKNDLSICGTLHSVDQYLNIKLTDISVTDPEKYPHMLSVKNCFIRGSVVRYVQLPADEVDTQLLQDAARKEAMQQKQ